jgi:hypothetical protein
MVPWGKRCILICPAGTCRNPIFKCIVSAVGRRSFQKSTYACFVGVSGIRILLGRMSSAPHVLTGRNSIVRTFMIAAACAAAVSPSAFAHPNARPDQQGRRWIL